MMTEFEIDILKRVLDSSDKTRNISIDSVGNLSEARTLTDNFRKNPDQYRGKSSIPTQSLKPDIDRFWDDYFSGKPL